MRALSCNHHIDLASKPIADSHTPKTLQALHSPCQFQAPVGSSYKQQKQNTYQPEQGRRGVASCRVLFWPGACLFFCCFGGPGKGALFFFAAGRVACLCFFFCCLGRPDNFSAVWAVGGGGSGGGGLGGGGVGEVEGGVGEVEGGGGGVGVGVVRFFLLFAVFFLHVCAGGRGVVFVFAVWAGGRVFLFAVWAGALFFCCLLFWAAGMLSFCCSGGGQEFTHLLACTKDQTANKQTNKQTSTGSLSLNSF